MQKLSNTTFFCNLIGLIICLNGCTLQNPKHTQIQHRYMENNHSFMPMEDLEEVDIFPPAEHSPSDIWDMSDVDISHIDPTRKLISFTFDDAPTRKLENLFAVFASYNESNPDCKASATYFFNGKLFDNENMQLLHTALAMGFELGNHTHSHYDLTSLSKQDIQAEIQKTDKILQFADGKKYHLLRAPFGNTNDTVKQLATAPIIDWTIDTVDWTGASAEEIYNTVMQNCFSGAIVLFHDGYTPTIEAVKRLLPDLKEKEYQVVNVSQLAKMHNCQLRRGKVYIRARKQS